MDAHAPKPNAHGPHSTDRHNDSESSPLLPSAQHHHAPHTFADGIGPYIRLLMFTLPLTRRPSSARRGEWPQWLQPWPVLRHTLALFESRLPCCQHSLALRYCGHCSSLYHTRTPLDLYHELYCHGTVRQPPGLCGAGVRT